MVKENWYREGRFGFSELADRSGWNAALIPFSTFWGALAMLGWFKEKTKFANIAGKWYDATRLNPGDGGQISVYASSLIKNRLLRAEDAWLYSLVEWTIHNPYPEFKFLLANGIIKFLDIYGALIPFDPAAKETARLVADGIIQEGILSGYPDVASKNYFYDERGVSHESISVKDNSSRSKPSREVYESKECCHCGGTLRIDTEVCGYPDCGLDPDERVMRSFNITSEGGRYKYKGHYFSKRVDAIRFAKMKTSRHLKK